MPQTKKSEENKKTTTKKVTTKTTKSPAKKTTTKKEEAKPAAKKTTTKKVEAKPATKKTTTKKVEAKPATKKTTTKKVEAKPATKKTTTKKVEVKPAVKKATPKKIEEVAPVVEEIVEPKVIVEEQIEEEIVDENNNKILVVILVLIVILFISGVVFVCDYIKNENKVEFKDYSKNETYNIDLSKNETTKKDNDTNVVDDNIETPVYSNIKEITVKEVKAKLENKENFILLIASKYCGHCNVFEPILNQVLVEKKINAFKIDVANFKDNEREEFQKLFEVSGTPTTFIIEKGAIKATNIGTVPAEVITNWINNNY